MFESIQNIQLSALQMLLILLGCGFIIWFGRPEWAMGIYMSTAAWNRAIMFGPIAHTWVFLAVAVMASISYVQKEGRLDLFPLTDRWIVAWMGLWWVWIIALLSVMEDPALRFALVRTFLCYIVVPLPIFLLFAGDVKRVKGFAIAYIITTIVGGYIILRMIDVTNEMLLSDPLLSDRSIEFMGLYNYHWFAYSQAISLIFIAGLIQENRNLLIRLILLAGAGTCAYFLMMAGSRQSIISVLLSLGVFIWWMLRRRGGSKVIGLLLLGAVFLIVILIFHHAPQLLRSQDSHLNKVMASGIEERWDLWMQGLTIFAGSPLWGSGFKDSMISHNIFVSTLADQGIIGMIFFIGFLVFFVQQVQGVWQGWASKELALWRMAFFCVALFGFFHSQASGSVVSIFEVYWSTAFLWHLGWVVKNHCSPTLQGNLLCLVE